MKKTFPLLAIAGLGLFLASSSKAKTTAPSLPFTLTYESFIVKDKNKTNEWFITQAREYATSLPDLDSFSYIDLTDKVLQKLNKDCFTKFNSQSLSSNGQIILAILRDKLQKAFIVANFGDITTLSDEDKINYNQFAEVISPEKLEEFSKFINWNTDLDKQLPDAIIAVDKYNKYPF